MNTNCVVFFLCLEYFYSYVKHYKILTGKIQVIIHYDSPFLQKLLPEKNCSTFNGNISNVFSFYSTKPLPWVSFTIIFKQTVLVIPNVQSRKWRFISLDLSLPYSHFLHHKIEQKSWSLNWSSIEFEAF